MALPATPDLRPVLRLDTTGEDALLDALIARATGAAEAFLDRPIIAESRTFVLEDARAAADDVVRLASERRPVLRLMIPLAPIAASPAVAITDADGATVDPANYRVDLRTGRVTAAPGASFWNFPYTVVATVGLSARADYERVVEPALSQAIIDLCADWYQRRNPAASQEGSGGGVSVAYGRLGTLGIPDRVREMLAPFRQATL